MKKVKVAKQIWKDHGKSPQLVTDKNGNQWLAYHSNNSDQIVAREVKANEGKMGQILELSTADIDSYDLSASGDTVIWNQLVDGVYQLYEYNLVEQSKNRITNAYSSVIKPGIIDDGEGNLYLVYQKANKKGDFNIYLQSKQGSTWTEPVAISQVPGNNWMPAITICTDGKLAIAWDGYGNGSYDIYLRFVQFSNGELELQPIKRLTNDSYYHANVSLAPTPDGGVWLAWNKGTSNWGKDNEVYRRYRIAERDFLHTRRFIELKRVYADRVLPVYPPVQDYLDEEIPGLLHERPELFTGDDRLYLCFRYNQGELKGGHHNEKRWQAVLISFDGENWSQCIDLENANGLSTANINLVSTQNRLLVAASGEGEETNERHLETKLSFFMIDKEAENNQVTVLVDPPHEEQTYPVPVKSEDLSSNSLEHKDKLYNLYFGDLHRHTELSYCRTCIDGSLEEAYRYGKDAVAMDFLMTADHDHNQQTSDMWEETMKNADRFYVPGAFTTFFGYEWIGGNDNRRHRNIVSTERVDVPPFDYGEEGHRDIRNTWDTLEKGKAITIPHHTACGMSLCWQEDPGEAANREIEPLVEIFQASRASSEYIGAPTLCNAFYKNGLHKNFNIKAGTVKTALKKDIRMGFISSSDHMSTHESYACVYAEENTREALMEAFLARRTYAATDRIICEFAINGALMGEELELKNNNKLVEIYVRFVASDKIKQITLLRDSEPYKSWKPNGKEVQIDFQLSSEKCKGHYFYVRMQQEDTNMAWSSPIWIK